MTTRLLSLALFIAAIYYLLRQQRPTPPTKADSDPLPLGRNQIEARFVIPLDDVEAKVS